MPKLTQLEVLRRFANFWSNVSALHIGSDVPDATQAAIVRGIDRAYGEEEPHAKGEDQH